MLHLHRRANEQLRRIALSNFTFGHHRSHPSIESSWLCPGSASYAPDVRAHVYVDRQGGIVRKKEREREREREREVDGGGWNWFWYVASMARNKSSNQRFYVVPRVSRWQPGRWPWQRCPAHSRRFNSQSVERRLAGDIPAAVRKRSKRRGWERLAAKSTEPKSI